METLTIRLPDDKHDCLKALAIRRKVSVNKLFEEFSSMAIAEFDAETRFLARASRGNAKKGIKLLDKLDKHHST
jgi:hypothetical protein